MRFNDDEPIVPPEDDSAGEYKPLPSRKDDEKIRVTFKYNKVEPLEARPNYEVMLKVKASGNVRERPGVDVVTVLDISGSMKGMKMEQLKNAMKFFIRKLGPLDRLSIVTFSTNANRLFPLGQVERTKDSQKMMLEKVQELPADGYTNIAGGLQMAKDVLDGRVTAKGRTAAVLLMSDGAENIGKAADVDVSNYPVYTFGFGADQDPKVLHEISSKAKLGGTFADAYKETNLNKTFAACLGGLLTTVVTDFHLTLKPVNDSNIKSVLAAGYVPKPMNDGSVTIDFSHLYNEERRPVIVKLPLEKVDTPKANRAVLEVIYEYSGRKPESLQVKVDRVAGAPAKREHPRITVHKRSLDTASMMKQARELADEKKMEEAKDILVEAQNMLEDIVSIDDTDTDTDDDDEPISTLVEMLKSELRQMIDLMESEDIYDKRGRSFALSSETSHALQRFAARGDDIGETMLFATPRMHAYLKQAEEFDKDPDNYKVPTEKEDIKEELLANPLAPIKASLLYYIQAAIEALKSINDIIRCSNI